MIWGGVQNQAAARSRVSRNLAVAVSAAETAAFALDPGANPVIEMSRMGTIKLPVKIVRRGEFKGAVSMSAVGLPANVAPKNNTNVDAANAAGEFEIKLAANSPLGSYSFCLLGISDVPYARNPEALKAALDRKAMLEKLSADETAAAKTAAEAKAAADKKLAETTTAGLKATEGAKAAEKAVADAQAVVTTATAKVTEAQAALDKDAANQGLIDAKQAAVKASEEAAAKLKTATDAKAVADKAAADAAAVLKTDTDAKAATDKAATDADAKAKQVAAFLTTFNQQLADLQNKSKANNIKVGSASTTLTLKITASPITLEVAAPAAALKQGAKVDVPVKIVRQADFADAVPLKLVLPAGVAGISVAANSAIAQGQAQGMLTIEATKDATPGAHKISVQAVPKFGGQDLPVTLEIPLTIEKVEPAK
jgi:hypothetical protein